MFSVIIPAYNSGPNLDGAIESVLGQTDQRFEVVVVDDHSDDGTYERALAWADKDRRIQVHRTARPSGGPAEPRNIGLTRSSGDFIAFLDHDDRWLPRKIEMQRAKFNEGDFALVYTGCRVISDDPARDGRDYHELLGCEPSEGLVIDHLMTCDFVPALTAAVRRDWTLRVGRFVVNNGMDDWHYWLRIALMGGPFGYLPEQLALYRSSEQSLTNRHPTPRFLARAEVFRQLAIEFPDRRSVLRRRERTFFQRHYSYRMARLPRPVRGVLRTIRLPPRLWLP